jgi:hypothetical protein
VKSGNGILMMDAKEGWLRSADSLEKPFGLVSLIGLHIVICCVSLVYVSNLKYFGQFNAEAFHIFFDPARLLNATAMITVFAVVALLFAFARFSFGYFVGFYLYTMVLGYLWINCFSDLNYNHRLAGLSAALAAVAFLLPALMIASPIRQVYVPSTKSFDRLLTLILLVALATIVFGGIHNFKFVAVENIYNFRDKLEFPTITAYLIGITVSALLPFAFASFIERREHWRAGATLLLALLFYPITLSKLALITPAWLVVIALLARIFGARTSAILSLVLPTLAGVLIFIPKVWPAYFYTVNFRTLAIPSDAMEFYNHYFSGHDLTYFCQIRVLKTLMTCPYAEQLSVVMNKAYTLGDFNGSMFATEGVASVGPVLAPVSMFVCGLVIALANRLSSGLPPRFILVSAAIFPQILLNVPLTITMLTHGMAILFLLWYITPRSMFEPNVGEPVAVPH